MPHGSPRGAAKAATPREGELGEPPPSPSPSPRPGMPPHVLRTTSSMLDVQAASFPDQTVSFRWRADWIVSSRQYGRHVDKLLASHALQNARHR